jgi:hypothetical protein
MAAKKHGVYIIEHKNWNTKEVWAHGYRQAVYRRQPKRLRFKSPMVNDENQDLCGGWHVGPIGCAVDENAQIFDRVIAGLKPMGVLHAIEQPEAKHRAQEARAAGFDVKILKHPWQGWNLVVAHRGTLRELFDLRALAQDYIDYGWVPDYFMGQVAQYADRSLISFAEGWDMPAVPEWVTGLLLGYPVENTLSVATGRVG